MTMIRTPKYGLMVSRQTNRRGCAVWFCQEGPDQLLVVDYAAMRATVTRDERRQWLFSAQVGVTEYKLRKAQPLGDWMWRPDPCYHERGSGYDPCEWWVHDVLQAIEFFAINELILGDDDEASGAARFASIVDGWCK